MLHLEDSPKAFSHSQSLDEVSKDQLMNNKGDLIVNFQLHVQQEIYVSLKAHKRRILILCQDVAEFANSLHMILWRWWKEIMFCNGSFRFEQSKDVLDYQLNVLYLSHSYKVPYF